MAPLLFLLIHLASADSVDCGGSAGAVKCDTEEFECISADGSIDGVGDATGIVTKWCRVLCLGSKEDQEEVGKCEWEDTWAISCDTSGGGNAIQTRKRSYKKEGHKGCEGVYTQTLNSADSTCNTVKLDEIENTDHECKAGLSPAAIAGIVIAVIVVIIIVVVVIIFCCCGVQCGGGGNKRHYY